MMGWSAVRAIAASAVTLWALGEPAGVAAQGGSAGTGPSPAAASAGAARIEEPRALTVPGGACVVIEGTTFSAHWGPDSLPPLAFVIGPGSAMADAMHASKAPFKGAGAYRDVIITLYLGKTALEDSYGGLGTVTVNADRRSGRFALNDGKARGSWSCPAVVGE